MWGLLEVCLKWKIKSWCTVVAGAASGVSQDVHKTFSYLGCWLLCKAFNSQFKDATLFEWATRRQGEQILVGEMIFYLSRLLHRCFSSDLLSCSVLSLHSRLLQGLCSLSFCFSVKCVHSAFNQWRLFLSVPSTPPPPHPIMCHWKQRLNVWKQGDTFSMGP